ncbi:MAG: PVC-type heme-binding CxxCH protein, partial [Roseimicrobium sp.]
MPFARFFFVSASFATILARAADPEPPVVNDPALRVELFAQEPLVQQPIGMTLTRDGKLLVIQSNTHFRPKNYAGPEHDRILWLQDSDNDGRADKAEVFFEGTDATMDIATAPDGAIYVSTRNEILSLRDDDGDGKAEKVKRRLVFLDTPGNYPHNGLSGLAFDGKGGLYFGMGENLGAAYSLMGTGGSQHRDQGDGGNVFHVQMDGGKLRHVAGGFWNPFGVCVDSFGTVFATDNDPDSRPPNRLLHLIEGGDYGYHFRYGRSGLHPFQCWNGEIPGTLPMLAGVGEAACDVIYYAPSPVKEFRGLPAMWHGTLLVASWVDHAIESYQLPDAAHAYDAASRKILVQGGADFRPVAFAVASDGSLYVSDWVKRDYELHGFGRVWRIRAREPRALNASLAERHGLAWKQEQLEKILSKEEVTASLAMEWLNDANPWRFSTAVTRLSRDTELLWILKGKRLPYPRQRQGLLLAVRKDAQRTGAEPLLLPRHFLTDADEQVRLLALMWISDGRLADHRKEVEELLANRETTPQLFYGAITALSRLDSAEVKEADMVKLLKQRLAAPATPLRLKRMALEILPDRERNLQADDLEPLLAQGDEVFREWVVQLLGTLRDTQRVPLLRRLAFDVAQPSSVRAAALMWLPISSEDLAMLTPAPTDNAILTSAKAMAKPDYAAALPPPGRPVPQDIASWRAYLAKIPGQPDLAHGRAVFLHPKLGGCALCHRVDGLGSTAGPNLSTIGAAKSADYILESLLQPSRNVAPQFEAFMLATADGQTRLAFQLMERGGTHTYTGIDGAVFDVKIEDILKRERLPVSIMPEGLVGRLTDTEIRDLLA